MLKITLFLYFLIFPLCGYMQAVDFLDSLRTLRTLTLSASQEKERIQNNHLFIRLLEESITPSSYKTDFDSIPSFTYRRSPDNQFRLFNWNFAYENGTHDYFAYIQVKYKDTIITYKLSDKSELIRKPERKITTHNAWFGALYYDIVPVKYKRKKYYVLLGWDGNNRTSQKKIIDVLTIEKKRLMFGKPIFKMPRRTYARVIFEYASDAFVSVRYIKKRKQIVFDHLVPLRDELKGIYEYYVPDMTFDALQLKKGKWYYVENVDIRLEKDPSKIFNPPR